MSESPASAPELSAGPNDFIWATGRWNPGILHLVDPGERESVCHVDTWGEVRTAPLLQSRYCRRCLARGPRAEPRLGCSSCETPTRVYRVIDVRYLVDDKRGITLIFLCTRCYGKARADGLDLSLEQLGLPENAVLET